MTGINKVNMAWYLEEYKDTTVNPGIVKFKVRCPFHEDRNASAIVFNDNQSFTCYSGCFDGRQVDVIDILELNEGMDRRAAIELVKDWPGTLRPQGDSSASTAHSRRRKQQRSTLSFKVVEV